MQHQGGLRKPRIPPGVQGVADNRGAQVAHVNAQLVGAPCLRGQGNEAVAAERPDGFPRGDGLPAARADAGELLPVSPVPGNPRFQPTCSPVKAPLLRLPDTVSPTVLAWNWRARKSWAAVFLATMITPEVSLSSLCTMPGRGSSAVNSSASRAQ